MKWRKQRLRDVADLCLGKMLDQNKNRGDLMPYLANVNVRWGEFDLVELREMRFEAHEMDRYGLRTGDIVMCEGGEPGRCAIWTDQMPGMMIQKALHRIRTHKGLDHRFLYYTFLNKGRKGEFGHLFTGATIKHLPGQNLAKLEIEIPTETEQARIASLLSTYDELIENNRRRMALLEKAARLLYEEWFVRLRFPGHEHTPIEGGVPDGWQRKPLSELTSFLKRGIAPRYDDDAPGLVINQKCIRNGRLDLNLARHQSREAAKDRQVLPGDVLVNSTGEGTLGRVAQVVSPIANCTVDTHVTIVRPKPEIPIHYFGRAVMAWEPRFSTMGRGATNQTELSPTAIGDVEILIPPKGLLKEFEEFAAPIAAQVETLTAQNQKLRVARDLMLPRLMSGEVEV